MVDQWQFPLAALRLTPSEIKLEEEMLRRQRGIDWLMRVGASLKMGLGPCLSAATFFHRFYMRRMIEDYHELEIAATCLFLASKTEENGKRLDDIVTVALAKLHSVDANEIAGKYEKEAKTWEQIILTYEEVLLEVLCFDFEIHFPHTYLSDIFHSSSPDPTVIDCAWSVAHDSYRTPLCVLETPQIIAAACYLFGECLAQGPHSPTLDERLLAASAAKPAWYRVLTLSEGDLPRIAVALVILVQFFSCQVRRDETKPDPAPYKLILPPTTTQVIPTLYRPADPTPATPQNGKLSSPYPSEIQSTPFPPKFMAPTAPLETTSPDINGTTS